MKKVFIVLALLLLGVTGLALAGSPSFPREGDNTPGFVNVASRSTDGALVGRPLRIYAATILTSSTNASINIYDNASAASGTVKVEIASATSFTSVRHVFDPPIEMTAGAYVDVTSAAATIEYR